jgi:hypothetical protein
MEESITNRTEKFVNYMNVYTKLYLDKYVHKTIKSIFSKCKKISSGIEGIIYKAILGKSNGNVLSDPLIVKKIDVKKLKQTKGVKLVMLNARPEDVYHIFYTTRIFNYPSLIEIVANTLTNQLVLQNVCPHYILNYHWNYDNNAINLYNEYATFGDFYKWAKTDHSHEIWMNALFQISVGLYAIKKYYNMHHTDFHTGNILVHKVKPGGYWLYTINRKNYYVPNLGYIFLLSDFGFAWIPNKLLVEWHYKDKLTHLTKVGLEFYDLLILIESIRDINLPQTFLNVLENMFTKSETYMYTTKYYKSEYEYYKNKNDIKKRNHFQRILNTYPNITKTYNGLNKTLLNKIQDTFYDLYKDTHGQQGTLQMANPSVRQGTFNDDVVRQQGTFNDDVVRQQGTLQMANPSVRQGTYNSSNEEFVRQQGTIIEKYSLDKRLKLKNFTTNFRHFIV